MSDTDILGIVSARIEGKQIEEQWHPPHSETWFPFDNAWDFVNKSYRVKQEPREWWIAPGDAASGVRWVAHETTDKLWKGASDVIHVREVIE